MGKHWISVRVQVELTDEDETEIDLFARLNRGRSVFSDEGNVPKRYG